MKKRLYLLILIIVSSPATAQTIPGTTIDHAWVNGVYVNPEVLPSWGIFANVQEENLFAAVYGYMGQSSTFITMQGTITSLSPLVFEGDVYFVTNGGTAVSDVGDFTWRVRVFEGEPSVSLDISSNILNMNDLELVRFSFVEVDKVDVVTGGNWNIIRRPDNDTFSDFYAIDDDRIVEQGETFAGVTDLADTDYVGLVGYSSEDEVYSLLIQWSETTDIYYVFYATNTDMYGRFWYLAEGQTPSGNGNHFRGAADNFQTSYSGEGAAQTGGSENRRNEISTLAKSSEAPEPMFPDKVVRDSFFTLQSKMEARAQ